LGQYLNYVIALEEDNQNRELYLAISDVVFKSFQDYVVINKSLQRYKVKILLFDLESKNILKWIK
jgi:hypothetical protein